MEKYFTSIACFAMRHGKCLSDRVALEWLERLEEKPLHDQGGLYESDRVSFEELRIEFKDRWGIKNEFNHIYQTWKGLIKKHGYNPFGNSRDSITYKRDKTNTLPEQEIARYKNI